jgi:hypothetical protein
VSFDVIWYEFEFELIWLSSLETREREREM